MSGSLQMLHNISAWQLATNATKYGAFAVKEGRVHYSDGTSIKVVSKPNGVS